jgi:hypothetical protein
MKRVSVQERRESPRIDGNLPIRVAVNGYDFETSTQNVSCTGAYCRVSKYMPPFTRVMVRLSLPVMTAAVQKKFDVQCRGVVVRTDDEREGGFNIAIFFNDIKDDEKNKISQYVNQFIPQEVPARRA